MYKSVFKVLLHRMGLTLKNVPKKYLFSGKKQNETKIGKFTITTNKDHSIGFNIKTYPLYNQNLPRLIKFLSSGANISVIDIGANIGDTVAYIRNVSEVPIFCFEGDDYYFKVLEKNTAQFEHVTLFKQYLSDASTKMNIAVSFSTGTASLTEEVKGDSKIVELKTLDEVIEGNPELFDTVKVIKIDTDGFDTKIIKGCWNFLQSHKPVLFFEYDLVFLNKQKEAGLDTLKKLAYIGYNRVFFYDNYGRFIVSVTLDEADTIECLHNYIRNYEAPFEFYDLCIFHKDNESQALSFLDLEKNLNSQKGR